jgi:hypothetical protein
MVLAGTSPLLLEAGSWTIGTGVMIEGQKMTNIATGAHVRAARIPLSAGPFTSGAANSEAARSLLRTLGSPRGPPEGDGAIVAPMTTQSGPPEKPEFLVRPAKIGGHWSVLYRPPKGIEEEIFGFDTQQEAQRLDCARFGTVAERQRSKGEEAR